MFNPPKDAADFCDNDTPTLRRAKELFQKFNPRIREKMPEYFGEDDGWERLLSVDSGVRLYEIIIILQDRIKVLEQSLLSHQHEVRGWQALPMEEQ